MQKSIRFYTTKVRRSLAAIFQNRLSELLPVFVGFIPLFAYWITEAVRDISIYHAGFMKAGEIFFRSVMIQVSGN